MQGIFRKENTDKALKYGIYRHLPTYEKIIRNLVSFLFKKESENYRDSNGQVKVQNTYKWKGSDGAYRNGAVCRDGKVTDLIRYVQKSSSSYSSSSNKYSSRSKSSSNNKLSQKKDEYDVYDYDDPEDFYYDHEDDFDEYGDAEDYWDEAQ